MQLEYILLINTLIQILVEAAGGIIAGIVAAIFAVYFTKRWEKKARIEAYRKRLVSEIELFQKACHVFDESGRGTDQADVVKNLALQTAQRTRDTFTPETMDKFPWDLLWPFIDELIRLAILGFGEMKWFLDQVRKLEQMADEIIKRLNVIRSATVKRREPEPQGPG
ncbi:MAG: hypothetical protein ACFE9D_01220 [Promethearchaeota archaeon]